MQKYRIFAVFSMLALIAMISVSSVSAQSPIGSTAQLAPFESSPTTYDTDKASFGAVTSPEAANDTDWMTTFALIPLTGNAKLPPDNSVRYFEVATFETPSPTEFDPGWVDIKIRYSCLATTDDQYRIVYRVAPDGTWYDFQPFVSGSNARADVGSDIIARSLLLADVDEPNDGAWDWTDVSNLVVRIETQMISGDDGRAISLYEVWATVYPLPMPPTSSTAMSIQPSVVLDAQAGEAFFVDVYVMGLTPPPGLGTYTINIEYDTSVISATEWYSYVPFVSFVGGGIDDPAGKLSIGYLTFFGDTVGFLGENTALLRIYFVGDAGGTSNLTLTFGELKEIGEPLPYYPPTYDGWVSVDRVMSYQGSLLLPGEDPIGTEWHEIHPDYCKSWTLTSWEDQEPGKPGYGELSECDQIDMKNETGWTYWFHVDEVTVTVHWEFKEGGIEGPLTGEVGAGEPRDLPDFELPPWDPAADPSWTGFHQIYPVYCRPFTVSGFIDTDGSGNLTVSDQIEIMYADDFTYAWAHVTDITTDILVSQKPIPPEPPEEPEFPLGLGLTMALALAIPIVYLWRTRKKVRG